MQGQISQTKKGKQNLLLRTRTASTSFPTKSMSTQGPAELRLPRRKAAFTFVLLLTGDAELSCTTQPGSQYSRLSGKLPTCKPTAMVETIWTACQHPGTIASVRDVRPCCFASAWLNLACIMLTDTRKDHCTLLSIGFCMCVEFPHGSLSGREVARQNCPFLLLLLLSNFSTHQNLGGDLLTPVTWLLQFSHSSTRLYIQGLNEHMSNDDWSPWF